MATATLSDFKIYNPEFQAGMWEGISQIVDAFNGASANAIRLVNQERAGQYAKEAIFTSISNMITRRDVTDVTSATAVKPAQSELVAVKVNRKIGPVEFTLDSLRKIGSDQREMSFILGQMVGEKKAQDMLNTGVLSVEAALSDQSDLTLDVTGETTKTITTAYLAQALAKMGDMSEKVVAWVMHSKPYFDLVQEQISAKITNVADRVVYGGNPATLNRPVVIADIPSLTDAAATTTDSATYNVLGLVEGGVIIEESEQSEMITEIVTGLENLVARVQGEYAMNIGCKGFTWDVTNGGANPTDATLGTTGNWDKVMTSVKDLSGVRLVVQ